MPPWTIRRHAHRRRWPRWRRFRRLAAVALMAIAAAVAAARLDPLPPPLSGTASAADGDSLRLAGTRVRLLGLDAPELDQPCSRADGSAWSCGEAAHRRLAELVAGAAVTCLPEGHDRYGRVLASCATAQRDLGAAMVAEGLALSASRYPAEEAAARAARRGIWDGEFVAPRQWRRDGGDTPSPGLAEVAWNWFRELTGARSLR